jgi:hypothetical protein
MRSHTPRKAKKSKALTLAEHVHLYAQTHDITIIEAMIANNVNEI